MKNLIIAIDGYAGSGKSTLAKLLANRLGYLYVDTGAMYRAFTYKVIKNDIDLNNTEEIESLLSETKIRLEKADEGIKVFLDNEDVTLEIRLPKVSDAVSKISALKKVRECMVLYQQELGKNGSVVLEGRDIGTVVFPEADIKFFLNADVGKRAQRRYEELKEKGIKSDIVSVEENLKGRDKKDSSRELSPLKPADDAILIDTTNLTIEEKEEVAWGYIENKIGE